MGRFFSFDCEAKRGASSRMAFKEWGNGFNCRLLKREIWCDACFDLCRFDRDWKKIEAFVGSKTVIQVA